MILHRRSRFGLNQIVGYTVSGIVTAAMIGALVLLIAALPDHSESPADLLRSAVGAMDFEHPGVRLVVLAAGCRRTATQRDLRGEHTAGAFLFPQMSLGDRDWMPGFMDYLFLAFNTSTAFSPTDVPVLSRWAKGMMMVQSTISLTTLALLAARAINIL